jgi:YesN/AraC family two-component response regulator
VNEVIPMAKHFNFEVIPLPNVPPGPHLVTNSSRRQSILVVDDEPLIADTLVAILRTKNYAANAAYNGYEAIGIAEQMLPDILLTDVMMPGMNGIDLAVAFRELVPDCRVLLFSGHAHLGHLLEDPRCAVHDFPLLPKPIHPEELLAHISNLAQATGSAA